MLEWFGSNVWVVLGISVPLLVAGSYFAQKRGSLLGFAIFTGTGTALLTLGIAGAASEARTELVEQGRTGVATFVQYGLPPLLFSVVCVGAWLAYFRAGRKGSEP